jgi:hypothetical protein
MYDRRGFGQVGKSRVAGLELARDVLLSCYVVSLYFTGYCWLAVGCAAGVSSVRQRQLGNTITTTTNANAQQNDLCRIIEADAPASQQEH